MNTSFTPTYTSERIQQLDLFRGFAIFGIFMVNILVMNVSFVYRGEWEASQTDWWSKIAFFLLETFFYGKFFVLFSLLFGMGVMLQYQKVKENGSYERIFFLRRFGSLLLFGIAHILFIWSGDILHLYGILGFSLLLFFKGSPRFILITAFVVFIFPFYSAILDSITHWFDFDYMAPLAAYSSEEITALKHHGSYGSGIFLRIKEFSFAMGIMYAGILPVALSMMLLGGFIVKKGYLKTIDLVLHRVKMPLLFSFIGFMTFRFALFYWIYPQLNIVHGSALSVALMTLVQLSDIVTSLSLLWVVAYCWQRQFFIFLLRGMQYVGRMAFTNYILQSILAYWIMRSFNGYGTFSVLQCILIVLLIYTAQLFLSKLWLKHFKYGPLEWFWRCISYWKWLPLN